VLIRPKIVWVSLLVLILQLSCAHRAPRPPREEIRENLGTIGLASGSFHPELSLQKSSSELARESAKGAGKASGAWLWEAAGTGDPAACLVAILTLPCAACVGCIVGAGKAEPAEELDAESEEALKNAFEQVNVQEGIRNHILRFAREKTNYTFVNLGEQGPSTPDEELDYSSVVSEGIDTILEIAALDAGLAGSGEIYPNLQFFMIVRIRLIRPEEGEEVYAATLTYEGSMNVYSLWAENNAQLFGEELWTGSKELSKRIVELLFAMAWSGKVVRVEDGDTMTVRRDGEKVKIRLYGIDTPERDQVFGKEAGAFTSRMVSGEFVEVEVPFRDRHGNTEALVRVDGVSLNVKLVLRGLAWVDSQRCLNSICNQLNLLEEIARQEKRGLWAQPNPIPPWEFRRKERK
jgi:endonuclease YncB( thermonuclease family)